MRLVAHNDGPDLRGSERQLLHLAVGLRARGHDVLVSCRPGGALAVELERAGVPATPVRPRGDAAVPSALQFRRMLRVYRPDAVLLTSWKRVFVGSWMARLAHVPRVLVRLGIVRGMPARGSAAWKLRRAFDRQVDALIVNSDAVGRAWTASAPWFPPERLRVIRNGVVRAPADPAALRRELALDPGVRLVGTVAALESRKGIDVLLRALALLDRRTHLVVAGDGPALGELRALADELRVGGRVHWLGARADVPDVLAGCAVFALPSRQDSTPNALLEAMAAGVPVVTTSGNGAEEAVGGVDGRAEAGWIVPPDDPISLARAICEAITNSAAPVAEARWRAEHWYGVERMVDEYESALFAPAGVSA